MNDREDRRIVFSAFLLGQHVAREVARLDDLEAREQTWELVKEVAEGRLTFVAPGQIEAPAGLSEEMEEELFHWSSDMRRRERSVARLLLDIHETASDI